MQASLSKALLKKVHTCFLRSILSCALCQVHISITPAMPHCCLLLATTPTMHTKASVYIPPFHSNKYKLSVIHQDYILIINLLFVYNLPKQISYLPSKIGIIASKDTHQ